jgi:hypothetical protein
LSVSAGQAWRTDGEKNNEVAPARTDEQGRFELAVGGAKSLAVSHHQFDVWPAAIPESGDVTVRLPEPARVYINLEIDGANKESTIYYELLVSQMPEFKDLLLRSERSVGIANPGKLELAGLPPGKYQLCRRPGRMLELMMFEIKSGEVKTIEYVRPQGARVRGKVTWPDDAKLTSINVTVVGEAVNKSPFFDYQWNTVYAQAVPAADGAFLTERIPPGRHQLVAYAFRELAPEERKRSGAIAPSYQAQMTIEVPADGELNVDDLVLKSTRPGK